MNPRTVPFSITRRSGFTLNELLVVIAIAVLVVALAVPAFNVITNSRSVDAAENQISSYLGRARAEAIGLQEPRGVMFFEDVTTGRTIMTLVEFAPYQATPIIDIVPGREEVALPLGVGWQAVPDSGVSQNFPWQPFGLVMFDQDGGVLVDTYRIGTGTNNGGKPLQDRIVSLKDRAGAAVTFPHQTRSTIGFVLFDSITFREQAAGTPQTNWLRDNASPYLVNRYNGTLLKGQ